MKTRIVALVAIVGFLCLGGFARASDGRQASVTVNVCPCGGKCATAEPTYAWPYPIARTVGYIADNFRCACGNNCQCQQPCRCTCRRGFFRR